MHRAAAGSSATVLRRGEPDRSFRARLAATARLVGGRLVVALLVGACGSSPEGEVVDQARLDAARRAMAAASGGAPAAGPDEPSEPEAGAGGGAGAAPSSSGGSASGGGEPAASGGGEPGGDAPCGWSWRVTYATRGDFLVTDVAVGDDLAVTDGVDDAIVQGALTVRFSEELGAPGEGPAWLLGYELEQRYELSAGTAQLIVDTAGAAASDECGLATGEVVGRDLRWDECDYQARATPTAWFPSAASAEGPGCLGGYDLVGTVACAGLCELVGLTSGESDVSAAWTQPLNTLELAGDFEDFELGGAGGPPGPGAAYDALEVPNEYAARTWVRLRGEELERVREPVPACACAE